MAVVIPPGFGPGHRLTEKDKKKIEEAHGPITPMAQAIDELAEKVKIRRGPRLPILGKKR